MLMEIKESSTLPYSAAYSFFLFIFFQFLFRWVTARYYTYR
jgi:hypothetical protein